MPTTMFCYWLSNRSFCGEVDAAVECNSSFWDLTFVWLSKGGWLRRGGWNWLLVVVVPVLLSMWWRLVLPWLSWLLFWWVWELCGSSRWGWWCCWWCGECCWLFCCCCCWWWLFSLVPLLRILPSKLRSKFVTWVVLRSCSELQTSLVLVSSNLSLLLALISTTDPWQSSCWGLSSPL